MLRKLSLMDLIVLNGHIEREREDETTMKWQGSAKSVLYLAMVPATCSANMEIIDVWEGAFVHKAVAV